MIASFFSRLGSDFWPPDASTVGPNLVASAICLVLGFVASYIFWPTFRKAVDKWLHGHLEDHHSSLAKRLDHIIEHHPDIPPMEDK